MTTTSNELAAAINVSFALTPETIIGNTYQQTGEDDYSQQPITLGEHVAELIATKLAADIKRDLKTYDYRDVAAEAVDQYAKERVESALDKLTQPTDAFGTPKGQAKTVAELIDDKITSWFVTRNNNDYGRGTNLDQLLIKAVDRQMQTAMAKIIDDARKQVLAALTAEAQKQMSTALAAIINAQVKA